MVKKLFVIFFFVLLFGSSCFSETQEMNPNQLKYKTETGEIITLTRKNYFFFSMIHQPLDTNASVIDLDTIVFPIIYQQDFAIVLSVHQIHNQNNTIENYINSKIDKENMRTDSLVATWDLNSLQEIPVDQLPMSNAVKGYLIYGYNDRKKPMKIKTIMGFLQSKDNSRFLEIYGVVSVNPENPHYDGEKEISQYLYDLKVDILTAKFE